MHRRSFCEEKARQEDAVYHCQECSKCRNAHSRTRMTRGHTTREVGATVLCHHWKDAAEGGLVREDGEPGSGESQEDPGLTTAPAAAVAGAPSGPGCSGRRTLVDDHVHEETGHTAGTATAVVGCPTGIRGGAGHTWTNC